MSSEPSLHGEWRTPPATGAYAAPLDAIVERVHAAIGERYRLIAPLGRGTLGSAFRAFDPALGHDVALKVLDVDGRVRPELYERVERAARAAAELEHPRILVPLAVERYEDLLCYTMPLMTGGSVNDLLRSRAVLPAERIDHLLRDVARVLDAVHARGQVHGGLSPGNILFDEIGDPHLGDFGITLALCAPGGIGGAAAAAAQAYAAPEQWRGQVVDGRADQYALALVAHELVTGRSRRDAPAIEGIRTLDPVTVLPDVPLGDGVGLHVNAALRTALSAKPSHRFSSATAFAGAFAGLGRAPRTGRAAWLATMLRLLLLLAAVALLLASALDFHGYRTTAAHTAAQLVERGLDRINGVRLH